MIYYYSVFFMVEFLRIHFHLNEFSLSLNMYVVCISISISEKTLYFVSKKFAERKSHPQTNFKNIIFLLFRQWIIRQKIEFVCHLRIKQRRRYDKVRDRKNI